MPTRARALVHWRTCWLWSRTNAISAPVRFPHGQTRMIAPSEAALRLHPPYFSQAFLDVAPGSLHMGTRLIHTHPCSSALRSMAAGYCYAAIRALARLPSRNACARWPGGRSLRMVITSYLLFGESGRRSAGQLPQRALSPLGCRSCFRKSLVSQSRRGCRAKNPLELPTRSIPYVNTTDTAHVGFHSLSQSPRVRDLRDLSPVSKRSRAPLHAADTFWNTRNEGQTIC